MREWTEKHIRELVDDEYKKIKNPDPTPVPISSSIINYRNMIGSGVRFSWPTPFYYDCLVNEGYMIEWVEYIGDVKYDNAKWSRYRWIRYENSNPIAKQLPPLREQKAIRYNGQVVPLLGFVITNSNLGLPAVLGNVYGETRIFAMKDGLKFPVLRFSSKKSINILDNSEFPEVIQYDPSNRAPIKTAAPTEYTEWMFAIDPTEQTGYDHWTYTQGTVYNCELYFDVLIQPNAE